MGKSQTKKGFTIEDPYLDKILLKIKRNHPESEGIQLLEEELKKIKIENGKNISYIAELENRLLRFQKMSKEELSSWKRSKKENPKIKELEEKFEKALKNVEDWQNKYFQLLSRNNESLRT